MLWYSDAGSDGRRVMSRFVPKVVVAIGVVLTIAWIGFLAWLVVHVVLFEVV
jgi:hypothetical protein